MSDNEPKMAVLTDDELAKVRALEQELGDAVVILAYDKPLEPARLNREQQDRLMDVEATLPRAYLVAYRRPAPSE
jgi:hypothetical protein